VESVKVDLTKNLLRVRYDPDRLTLPEMQKAIDAKGYVGHVVPEGAGSGPP
jgi:hypothetical protein